MKLFKRNKINDIDKKIVDSAIQKDNTISEEIVNKTSDDVRGTVDNVLVQETKRTARRTSVKKKSEPKQLCKVLFANPVKFIVLKNGEKITVEQKNSYHRGEEIYF